MADMEITEIEIFPFDTKGVGGNTLAIADVTLDEAIKIKSIRLTESKSGGIFLSYPSIRGKTGNFIDIVVIKDNKLKKKIRDRVVEEYKRLYG